jgi:hypothetical protein
LKHIILKIDQEKFKTLKIIIKEAKDLFPNIAISPIKQGYLGDEIMASFTVDDEHYQQILGKLKEKDISLFGSKTKDEKKQVTLTGQANYSAGSNISPDAKANANKSGTPASILEFAVKNGDYEKVIQLSKDYRSGFEVLKKAKDSIDAAIKHSIDIVYGRAIKNKFEVSNCLTHLIKIASDKDLKTLHKNDLIKSAGLKAVELCSIYKEFINILVQICNNNAIPQIVCMKAAIKLAYILNSDDEKAEENMDYVARYLNLRWLNIVFYTVSVEISEKEKEVFRILIESVKGRSGGGKAIE